MEEKISRQKLKFLSNKSVKLVAISLFLLLLWFGLTLFYVITFDTSFSIWSYNHSKSDIKNLSKDLIYKGKTIRGEFVAQDNNLGIISVRFQTYIRPPYALEDSFLFRLKEKNAGKWYYENVYRSGLVYDVPFFPFGFPQISDSKGRIYDFEITSLSGNVINGLSISNRYPILVSKYKYSGHELWKNKEKLIKFLITKFSNAMQNPDVIFSSFIYLLPLIFYLVWISFLEKIIRPVAGRLKKVAERLENTPLGPFIRLFKKIFIYNLDYFLVFVVLIDVLVMQLTNDVTYAVIMPLWVATLKVYGDDGKKSFIVSLVFIIICPLFLGLKSLPTAEKSAVWAYMFLIAGVIQTLLELKSAKQIDEET